MYGKAKLLGSWASHQPQRLKGPMHEDIACSSAGPPVSEAWGGGCQEQLGWGSQGEVQCFTPTLHQARCLCTCSGLPSALQVKAAPEVLGRRQSARDPFTLHRLLQTSLADDHSLLSAPAEPSLAPTPFPLCRIHTPFAFSCSQKTPQPSVQVQVANALLHSSRWGGSYFPSDVYSA